MIARSLVVVMDAYSRRLADALFVQVKVNRASETFFRETSQGETDRLFAAINSDILGVVSSGEPTSIRGVDTPVASGVEAEARRDPATEEHRAERAGLRWENAHRLIGKTFSETVWETVFRCKRLPNRTESNL